VITVLLGGRYELERMIAGGGMGAVWRAVDRRLDRPVAVKLLRRSLASDPAFVERFRREARAAAALSHPNVAGVFDYGEHEGEAFIVMELVEGENLAERLAREGPLPWPRALGIAEQVARALAAAHAHGLVHRDVKPANILLNQGTHPPAVKVTDFGIARAEAAVTLTGTGAVLGSAAYVAPEQASGSQVGPAADLYGLGCVLFEMVTGRPPYRGESAVALATQHVSGPVPNPRQLRPELPGAVAAIILRALRKDPAARFASAAAMADALAGAGPGAAPGSSGEVTAVLPVVPGGAVPGLAAAPAGAAPRRTVPPGPPPRVRYPRPLAPRLWAGAAVVAAVAALALLAWLTVRDANQAAPPRQQGHAAVTTPPARVRLPDLRGLSDRAARAALQRLGLRAAPTGRHGVVTGTRPRPGSLLRRGSTVRLLLASRGGHDGDGKGKREGDGHDKGTKRGDGES
jgi:eukaryotic-like serine/threonine-protein kinase